jgi:2-polyprenyl-6-methoxyphenol hydroxylase-like FAD-dependent oxidoreductase
MTDFDVIVVGARCAGAPLATLLARRGLRVCLLDRAHFPSDTPSTHVLQPCGVEVLDRLGVLPAVLDAGGVPLDRFSLVVDDARVDADLGMRPTPTAPLGGAGLSVRRLVLDALLVDAAAAAGAQVRTGTNVTGVLTADGRVCGVRTAAGELRAAVVVGADGRRSTIAEHVGAASYYVEPAGRLFAWGYFAGAQSMEPRLRIGRIGDLAYAATPTDSDLFLAAVAPPRAHKAAFLADRERHYAAGIRAWPELADIVAGATRVGPLRVVADWQACFRTATGPGWVLVGDAGHFKDPAPAQGMADALRHAERLAGVLERGLGGSADLDAELTAWWHWRDRDTREIHWLAADIGAAGGTAPIVTQFLRDLGAAPDGGVQLLRLLNHELRPAEVFTPGRMARAAARAARRRPPRMRELAREARALTRTEWRRARQRRIAPVR